MQKWWRFNQGDDDSEENFKQIFRWTNVMPGDVVQSRGTCAYHLRDFEHRNGDTKILTLAGAPVLVLTRYDGIPNEKDADSGYITFICLSRHGLIVVIGWKEKDEPST